MGGVSSEDDSQTHSPTTLACTAGLLTDLYLLFPSALGYHQFQHCVGELMIPSGVSEAHLSLSRELGADH